MRDPILHIKQSDLGKVLSSLGVDVDPANVLKKAHEQHFQLRRNYIVKAANSKLLKKLEKNQAAENDVTDKFSKILVAVQQIKQKKHVPIILKGGQNYILLKEIAKLALEYTEHFKYSPIETGFKVFCETAMLLMERKYKIEKIKYYLPKIYDYTECLLLIEKDINPEGSKEFLDTWKKVGAHYSTSLMELISTEDFLHIIYARDEADEMKAKYKDWITAQFEGLSFLSAIPELNQLYGINARKRYDSYMKKMGYKKDGEVPLQSELKEHATSEGSDYWKFVRAGKEKRGEKI